MKEGNVEEIYKFWRRDDLGEALVEGCISMRLKENDVVEIRDVVEGVITSYDV